MNTFVICNFFFQKHFLGVELFYSIYLYSDIGSRVLWVWPYCLLLLLKEQTNILYIYSWLQFSKRMLLLSFIAAHQAWLICSRHLKICNNSRIQILVTFLKIRPQRHCIYFEDHKRQGQKVVKWVDLAFRFVSPDVSTSTPSDVLFCDSGKTWWMQKCWLSLFEAFDTHTKMIYLRLKNDHVQVHLKIRVLIISTSDLWNVCGFVWKCSKLENFLLAY